MKDLQTERISVSIKNIIERTESEEEIMTYEELVKQVKEIAEGADAEKIQEHVAFQFNIEGEAAGAFYLEVKDGKAVVEPYEYYDRDVLIRCTADTLLKIVEGKLDPVFAFTVQKIKVEGDLGKALLLKEVVGQRKAKKTK